MKKADIGVIGLSVMGANLARNFESRGYTVAVYNRTSEKTKELAKQEKGKNFIPSYSLKEFIDSLARPKKVLMMVKAGQAVDEMIDALLPLMKSGDVLIDGGNTFFKDTVRRVKRAESLGILYIGTGVSGGEERALLGPSIMPGGNKDAWPILKEMFEKIAAKVEETNEVCCQWVGADGAGHFVKMVHNGIEYADMQLISESYSFMRYMLNMTVEEMHLVFNDWRSGPLKSYLIDVTADVLNKKDDDGGYLIDKISDTAGQKGTGNWTSQTALELGVAIPTMMEAVNVRFLSSLKKERNEASSFFKFKKYRFKGNKDNFLKSLADALYASKIIAYAQGYTIMQKAAEVYGWDLDYSGIAAIWREGCIIRAKLLSEIMKVYKDDRSARNLITTEFFRKEISDRYESWKNVVVEGVLAGIALPGFTSALSYFEAYRNPSLPTNLIQAQRDYFGAHTYERIDKPGKFHTKWK